MSSPWKVAFPHFSTCERWNVGLFWQFCTRHLKENHSEKKNRGESYVCCGGTLQGDPGHDSNKYSQFEDHHPNHYPTVYIKKDCKFSRGRLNVVLDHVLRSGPLFLPLPIIYWLFGVLCFVTYDWVWVFLLQKSFDALTSVSTLQPVWVSKTSAIQRKGRWCSLSLHDFSLNINYLDTYVLY